MNDLLFLTGLGFLLAHFLGWGFKHLPGERWQMLAVVPVRKGGDNHWLGSNLTYYGFYGPTKKVVYEGRLAGEKLLPIQAITCVLYTSGALIGSYLFLIGWFTPALIFAIVLTQMWRILSETMRADFRGFGNISAYQKMGVMSVLYILAVVSFVQAAPYSNPEIIDGLGVLWSPSVILGLQLLWLAFFVIFGRSTVTTSTISFTLVRKHI